MIAYIKGKVTFISENKVIIETQGIGYQVFIPTKLNLQLNNDVKLYTHMQVKEDGVNLYGFAAPDALHMFNHLTAVSGIGPKVAMGVLSTMNPVQIAMAVISEDTVALSQCPGIGKKTAQRLVLELKDKLSSEHTEAGAVLHAQQTVSSIKAEKQDAIDALVALGYSPSESLKAVMEVAIEGMSTEQIIKQALRKMMKGGL